MIQRALMLHEPKPAGFNLSLTKAKLLNKGLRLKLRSRDLPELARANLAALDHLEPARPAREYSYVVMDLETTGLSIETDRVVSVAAVRMRKGQILLGDSFTELVNPGRNIPAESIKIHGIKPDQVEGARHAADVFQDFLAWLGTDILVAHYAEFDLHFTNFTMQRLYQFNLQNLAIDLVRMCQGVVLPSDPYGINRNRHRCGLDDLAERFGLSGAERHTAAGDALVSALIFQRMLAQMEQKGPARLKDLMRVAMLS
jgi:DNA polymerase-3 subunit epsilon